MPNRLPDPAGGIQPSTLTTTGDILYASSAQVAARLGIGSSAQVLTVSSGVPAWATPAGGGKVLQVVQATYSTVTTIASTSLTDTGLTATITPSLSSSKVLVLVSQIAYTSRTNFVMGTRMAILRGATNIFDTASYGNRIIAGGATSVALSMPFARNFLDSPSTTSATTYKTQMAVESTAQSGQVEAQIDNGVSSIILIEIGV